jgi:hypothetical protein
VSEARLLPDADDESERDSDPFITCPVCHKRFQHGDAWELGQGSEVECRHCETPIVCESEYTTRYWYWKRKRGEEAT